MEYSIFIYKPFDISTLDLGNIKSYILSRLNNKLRVEIKENPLMNREELAEQMAKIRITNISKVQLNEPLPAEINYERRCLKGELLPEGILYDGFELMSIFAELIKDKLSLKNIHIFLTNRLIGTFDDDHRYHARTNILGTPSVISLTGMVEAPARPKEFYLLKQKNIPLDILKERFKWAFIDYNDSRLTEITKGYIMQGIFYQLFREGFCQDKNCRLFNAHWQEEMINAQLNDKFCEKHSNMLGMLY